MLFKAIFVSCIISFALCDVFQQATYASKDCSGAMIGVKVIGSGYVGTPIDCTPLADGRSVKAFNGPFNLESYRMAPWNWYQVQDHGNCSTINDITSSTTQNTVYIMNGTSCWTSADTTASFAFKSCSNNQAVTLDGISAQDDCSGGTPSSGATANTCSVVAGAAFFFLCGSDVQPPMAAPVAAPVAATPSGSNTPAKKSSDATIVSVSAASLVLGALLV